MRVAMSAGIKETARRAAVLVRTQLESLRVEGSLSSDDVKRISDRHPRSVGGVPLEVAVPQRNLDFRAVQMTYLEATQGLLARVARRFSDPAKTLAELDPLGVGWFSGINPSPLLMDLVLATVLVRNRALDSHFSDSAAIEARTAAVVLDLLGNEALAFYDEALKVWLLSVADATVPQLVLGRAVMQRSYQASDQAYEENPLKEIAIAEMLVSTEWYFWATMAVCAELEPD